MDRETGVFANPHGMSPIELCGLGRLAQRIRNLHKTEHLTYEVPHFDAHKNECVKVDVTQFAETIRTSIDNEWIMVTLMLLGEFCHDLLFYMRSRGKIFLKVGNASFQLEKRGKASMDEFVRFCSTLKLNRIEEITKLLTMCTASQSIAEKVHIRTLLLLFADIPSLFIPNSPVKLDKILGSGGQRTIFQVRTSINECYAMRPDARDRELENMFNCLEAIDGSHLFHIFEAEDYDNNSSGRLHLFMPVMLELDEYFTRERLFNDVQAMVALVYHVALQLEALENHGTVHRDVKPANILVYFDLATPSEKCTPVGRPFFFLTDFGWSCMRGIDCGSSVGGTKQYRDPYMYVVNPHPKHDIWGMALAFLFLINRVTEHNTRATMVRKIKSWQEMILLQKSDGQEFSIEDFHLWRSQWEVMALGTPLEDIRRFRVGPDSETTWDFRELLRGCLNLRWDKRWQAKDVIEWARKVAIQHGCTQVIDNRSFRRCSYLAQKNIS